jgi:hypothetical protein
MHHTMHYCPWNIEQPADCGSNNIVPFPRTAPARKCGVAFVLFSLLPLSTMVLLGTAIHLPKYECVGAATGTANAHWHRGSR